MFALFDPRGDFSIAKGANLPHWFQPGVSYFVTFRTEDSIPSDVSRRWHAQRVDWLRSHGIEPTARGWQEQFQRLPDGLRSAYHHEFSGTYLRALDKGAGDCVLRRPELAKIVADALLHFDGQRYDMGDFVVMPNHVHLMVGLRGRTEIEAQCTSWKRFTAKMINAALSRSGRFWQEESFDHLIRSARQFTEIQQYIADNPAGLKAGEYLLYKRPA